MKIYKLLDLVVWTTILVYLVFLLSHVSPSRHVDPDFFQFLWDSEHYLNFRLPPYIQSLPANPILIGLLFGLLQNHFTEIEVALLINAFSMSFSIAIFYYLAKKTTSLFMASVGTIYLITNQIIIDSSTSNNTEVLFTFFIMFISLLAWKKRFSLAIALSGLGILIRYESIIIFIALVLSQFSAKNNFSLLIKNSLLFTLIAFPILFVLLNQNQIGGAANTPFLVELVQRIEDIPEERFFTHFPITLFAHGKLVLSEQSYLMVLLGALFWISFAVLFYKNFQKTDQLAYFFSIFTILFLLFHTFFPAYLERYFVPTIFTFTFVSLMIAKKENNNFKIVFATILILIAISNVREVFSKKNIFFLESSDYWTAEIIKKNTDPNRNYIVLSPYHEIIWYYYKNNKNIKVMPINFFKKNNDCENLECAFLKNKNNELIIPFNNIYHWGMVGNYDNSLRKWYESIGFYELGQMISTNQLCLWHREEVSDKKIFVELYKPCYK